MDKEQETLDMVLDIPNTVSLNPFDRPPNIMDDDLNSVTQEELEANLSTDCPANAMDTVPAQNCNDMWEQLIQSFLEDNSTEDAVLRSVNTEEAIFEAENASKKNIAKLENTNSNEKQESILEAKQSLNNPIKEEAVNSAELREEKLNELNHKTDEEVVTKVAVAESIVKDEHAIMDITVEEEEMLVSCMYDVDENEVDQNDLYQVEVYATNHQVVSKQEIKEQVKRVISDDEEDDCLSNISSESLGYLEPIKKADTAIKEELLKKSQLSTIISDHCYSQESSANTDESDALKQNVISHIMKQNISNRNIHKIANFVNSLLHDLDNNKLEIILNAMNISGDNNNVEETVNTSIEQNKTLAKSKAVDDIADMEQNQLSSAENEELQANVEEKQIFGEEVEQTNLEQNVQEVAITETSEILSQHYELGSQHQLPTHNDEDTTNDNENILSQSKKSEENKTSISEVNENKSENGTLPFNCSETLEHQIFDEEFEILCKNGVLPLKNNTLKSEPYNQLLDKLKDFASQIRKDCDDLCISTAEEKLQDYIKMQYCNFQKLFINKQTVETQTKRKKLTKRSKKVKHSESPKTLLKSAENLNRYSSTSAESSCSSSPCSSDENENEMKTKETSRPPSAIKSLPQMCTDLVNPGDNITHEYDDGINLSQYVQSEIFNIESLSPQSTIISDSECDSLKEEIDTSMVVKKQASPNEEDSVAESDDTIIFKITSKKNKKLSESLSETSPADAKKTNKNQVDKISVHSESDKENLNSDRKEKKSTEPIDEDERNDREIDR